ncbi:hypothetical protein [Oryza sativa Japonica Group]|uniref:Uncharacterized protein n=1 Tax=Oryza sativa subsp. japonica TaxID=39947 RepID=Q5JML2_ORYSJ|nr:hypothetical protein [Oryza sativa Japonica Group]
MAMDAGAATAARRFAGGVQAGAPRTAHRQHPQTRIATGVHAARRGADKKGCCRLAGGPTVAGDRAAAATTGDEGDVDKDGDGGVEDDARALAAVAMAERRWRAWNGWRRVVAKDAWDVEDRGGRWLRGGGDAVGGGKGRRSSSSAIALASSAAPRRHSPPLSPLAPAPCAALPCRRPASSDAALVSPHPLSRSPRSHCRRLASPPPPPRSPHLTAASAVARDREERERVRDWERDRRERETGR